MSKVSELLYELPVRYDWYIKSRPEVEYLEPLSWHKLVSRCHPLAINGRARRWVGNEIYIQDGTCSWTNLRVSKTARALKYTTARAHTPTHARTHKPGTSTGGNWWARFTETNECSNSYVAYQGIRIRAHETSNSYATRPLMLFVRIHNPRPITGAT